MKSTMASKIKYPSSINRALLPTPIEPLSRYGKRFEGVDVWIKRDDLTGFELSGNKVRKLEFSMAAALEQGAGAVVTCGGVNSNHCRATTFLARSLDLDVHLFLRTPDGQPPTVMQGNTLLNLVLNADYLGRGYGLTTREELIEIAEFARCEGILLDPCYTGKAFIGMNREIMRGTIPHGSRVLFWHTGGALGNFSYETEWGEALN